MNKSISLIIIVLIPAMCGTVLGQSSPSKIRIESDTLLGTSSLVLDYDSCRTSLEYQNTELNRGVLHFRPGCLQEFRSQVDALITLYAGIKEKDGFHTLFWGRLNSDLSRESVLSQRLAEAALKSEQWDADTGQPSRGRVNEFVKNLLNEEGVFAELRRRFSGYDTDIFVSGVEKVLLQTGEKSVFWKKLKNRGVDPQAKIPVDALIWFTLSR